MGEVPDASQMDSLAGHATEHLLGTSIPAFARQLDSLAVLPGDSHGLTVSMHATGVNARYLGRLASCCSAMHSIEACEVEMVARTCKHVLLRNLRQCVADEARRRRDEGGLPGRGSREGLRLAAARSHYERLRARCRAVCVDFFNLCLGESDDSALFWQEVVVPSVYSKFAYRLRGQGQGQGAGGAGAGVVGSPLGLGV